MKQFSRTIEKVLAWIANVLLILLTLILAVINYSGIIDEVRNSNDFYTEFQNALARQGQAGSFSDQELRNIMDIAVGAINVITILLIVLSVVAIIASVTMKKRIFSGILFLILAVITLAGSWGSAFLIYIPYFVVAIMLFVRKPKDDNFTDFNNNNDEQSIDKIEYV